MMKIRLTVFGHYVRVIVTGLDELQLQRPILHKFPNELSPYIHMLGSTRCGQVGGHEDRSNIVYSDQHRVLYLDSHKFK